MRRRDEAAHEASTGLTRVLSALAQSDPDISDTVAAMNGELGADVREVASAMVYGGKAGKVRSADLVQVAPVAAYRQKVDRPGLGSDGAKLLVKLAGDPTILKKLSLAWGSSIQQSVEGFLQSRLSASGVLHLRLSDTDILQIGVSENGVLQVQLSDTDILQVKLSARDILQVRLSDTDILQVKVVDTEIAPDGQERKLVRLSLSDTDILQLRLSDTDILQLSLSDTDILQAKLSDTDILQIKLSDTEVLQVRLSDTDILQSRLSDTDILQSRLSDTDILQSRMLDMEAFRTKLSDVLSLHDSEGCESTASLSDTDILQLKRRERFVSMALKVLEECGLPSQEEDVSELHLKVVELLSLFVGPDREKDVLAFLLVMARFLPALERVTGSNEVHALERLARQQPEILLALARMARERPDLLKALVDLVTSDVEGWARIGQRETALAESKSH